MSAAPGSPLVPLPMSSLPTPPPLRSSTPDRWARWQATERQRADDAKRDIELALLMAVILIALGGAIYLSFWSEP